MRVRWDGMGEGKEGREGSGLVVVAGAQGEFGGGRGTVVGDTAGGADARAGE